MRRRHLLPLPAGLALAGALVACTAVGSGTGPEDVDVAGGFGARPTVTFDVPFAVTESSVTVVIDGEGPDLVDGAAVLLDWLAIDGSTGEVIAETYPSAPEVFAFTPESLGDALYSAVRGSGTNDRVLYLEPATGESGLPAANVVVVDIRPARAQGERFSPPSGLPGVQLAANGAPTITIPGGDPPPDRVEQVLIKGDGQQVAAGSELIVQFTRVRWSDGAVEATTWGEGSLPERLDLSESMLGLSLGLLDQTVGSQVLLVVPPAEATGADTRVFVVDILAVASEANGEEGASPVPTASVSPSG